MKPANADVDIHDPEFVGDPFSGFERLRQECPVAYSDKFGGFYVLSSYADVRAAAIDWRSYTSSVPGVTAIPVITPRTEPMLPIEVDPPLHNQYRALMAPLFADERVREIEPRIAGLARSLMHHLAAEKQGEWVSGYCIPIAVNTLAAVTDLPLSDSALWVDWITRMFNVNDREDGAKAAKDMGAYVRSLIAERRKAPNGDFVSQLIAAEINGAALTDTQIHSFITVVFGAGFETTADGMSVMLHWLAAHPEGLEQVRAKPELIPLAVEEFLRFATPVQVFGRNATRDIVLHNRTIPKDAIVGLAFAGGNYDADVFECPHQVKLDRTPNRHLAFGAGPHLCAGASVARMELRVTLSTLLELELRLQPAADQFEKWKTRGDRRGLSTLNLSIS
jgi:cytochrome P450